MSIFPGFFLLSCLVVEGIVVKHAIEHVLVEHTVGHVIVEHVVVEYMLDQEGWG